jgi:rsbT co-antagonist protein RsbR
MNTNPEERIAALEAELTLLRASERRFRLLTEQAPGITYVLNLDSLKIVYFNHDLLLGHSMAELNGRDSLGELVHPEDRERARANWQQALAGQSAEVEYRLLNAAGGWEWVATKPVLLRDAAGAPAEMALFVTVITERQQLISDMADSKRRFELMVQSAGQIIYDYDVNTGEIGWSGAVEPVLGFRPAEMDGGIAQWAELIHEQDAPAIFRAIEDAERECAAFSVEYRFRRKDGSYAWLLDRGFFLAGDSGKPERMLGIMQDITLRRENEEQRRQSQELVIAAQQAALRELSTPLIPVRDDVLVMPLVGTLDSMRAQQIIEALLSGVEQQGARAAIIDITGVSIVDTQVANALLQAAQAVRLLGAQVVLTGIRPEVAQTLVGLGVDLRAITTRATLQDGIATVLRRLT